ncbi:MAG: sugar ABC transporter substrate-binding protein, partial [Hyphomicrobiales bacterium]
NLAVFQSSKNKEAAWKFVEFLVREDVNGDVVDLLPANKAAAGPFLAKNRDGADRIMSHLENAAPRPLSARYLQIADLQMRLYQDVFSGKDVAESAAEACKAIDALN